MTSHHHSSVISHQSDSYIESPGFLRLYLVAFSLVLALLHAYLFYVHSIFVDWLGRIIMGGTGFFLGSSVLILSLHNSKAGRFDENKPFKWFVGINGLLIVLIFQPWRFFQAGDYGTGAFFMLIGPVLAIAEYLLNKIYHLKKNSQQQYKYHCPRCSYATDDAQKLLGHMGSHAKEDRRKTSQNGQARKEAAI